MPEVEGPSEGRIEHYEDNRFAASFRDKERSGGDGEDDPQNRNPETIQTNQRRYVYGGGAHRTRRILD